MERPLWTPQARDRPRVCRRDNQVVPIDANPNINCHTRTELDFVLYVRAGLPSAVAAREVDGIVRDMDVREANQVREVAIAAVAVREVFLWPEAHGIHAGLDRVPSSKTRHVRLATSRVQHRALPQVPWKTKSTFSTATAGHPPQFFDLPLTRIICHMTGDPFLGDPDHLSCGL